MFALSGAYAQRVGTDLRDRVGEEPLDSRDRWAPPGPPVPLDDLPARGWHALTDLLFPVVLLRDSALRHNQDVMTRFCASRSVSLAPHGKTHMSPQLVRRQLDAGAWGMTAASPAQARLFRAFGAERVLIANEVVDPAGLRWIAAELGSRPDGWLGCLVDSERGVALMERGLAGAPSPLPVLVELGLPDGRAGCRSPEEALRVAAAVAGSPTLRLAGVECFEGIRPGPDDEVERVLTDVRETAESLARAGAFDGLDEVLVTAGGSLLFDRVAERLAGGWDLGRPVRVVLRSGCYLTHDHGGYLRGGPFGGRLPEWPPLRPALEAWGLVHSRPEPTLAILGFGKRDVSYDLGLPEPLWVRPAEGGVREAADMEVFRLNDQHAYLRVAAADPLAVGDRVGCGLSHPCTVFDKWRSIPVVDDEDRVVSVARTCF
jgi:D-serine deaminase-like pyridoxal phosphate-dependent protein